VQLSASPADHHVRVLKNELERVIGRVSSHATIPLFHNLAGTTITLVAGANTQPAMGSSIDFADGGLDGARLIVYGTPPANDCTVQAYNVTTGQVIATAVMKGGAPAGWFTGSLTQLTPRGGDEQIQVRFVGTGAQQPVVNTIHLQAATLNLKP
jgi:hypothetical protein